MLLFFKARVAIVPICVQQIMMWDRKHKQ